MWLLGVLFNHRRISPEAGLSHQFNEMDHASWALCIFWMKEWADTSQSQLSMVTPVSLRADDDVLTPCGVNLWHGRKSLTWLLIPVFPAFFCLSLHFFFIFQGKLFSYLAFILQYTRFLALGDLEIPVVELLFPKCVEEHFITLMVSSSI